MRDSRSLTWRLARLRKGLLSDTEIADTVLDLGHSELLYRDDVLRDLTALVDHPDPDIRSEAIRAMAFHGVIFDWQSEPGKTLLKNLVEILRHDTEVDSRRTAAAGLGSFFKGTHDQNIMRILFDVVTDDSEEDEVRAFAYTGFLDVVGVPVQDQPSALTLKLGPSELETLRRYMGQVAS